MDKAHLKRALWALPIVMHLHNHDGSDQTVGDSYQVFNETRDATFNRFVAAVPAEFKALAQAPYYPYRIIAPGSLPAGWREPELHVAGQSTAIQNDPTQYYKTAPANYYAKFWHDNAVDGKAYGFPYDDDAGQSSYISHANPQYLQVAVGW